MLGAPLTLWNVDLSTVTHGSFTDRQMYSNLSFLMTKLLRECCTYRPNLCLPLAIYCNQYLSRALAPPQHL